jgi:hypothetical protein
MRTILLLIGLLVVPLFLLAQPAPDTLWTRVIGGAEDDVPSAIRQTSDGGYIIAGKTNSFGAGGYDALIIKLDSSGNTEWQQTYGGADDDAAFDVRERSNGGYIATCALDTTGSGRQKLCILKIDPSGISETPRAYFECSRISSGFAVFGMNNEMFLAGTADSTGSTTVFYWRFRARIDSSGDTISTRVERGFMSSQWGRVPYLTDVEPGPGNDYFLAGGLRSRNFVEPNHIWDTDSAYCDHYSDADTLLWYVTASNSLGKRVLPTADGGCLFLTTADRILRISAAGQMLWTHNHNISISDIGFAVRGGYVSTRTIVRPDHDIELQSYDSAGTSRWVRTWGAPASYEQSIAVTMTHDSGYVLLGTTGVSVYGHNKIYIIKTGSDRIVFVDTPKPSAPESFVLSAYPNPFNPATTLSFSLPKVGVAKLTIYDLNGRVARVLQDGMMEAGEHRLSFDGSLFPSGIYFARISAHGFESTHKLVLLK